MKTLGRNYQPPDALMGALVIVVFDPASDSALRLMRIGKMLPIQQLVFKTSIAGLYFTQRLGMMGPGMNMVNALILQIPFKTVDAAP